MTAFVINTNNVQESNNLAYANNANGVRVGGSNDTLTGNSLYGNCISGSRAPAFS